MRPHWLILGLAAALLGTAGAARADELNKPPKGFVALFNGKDLTHWQGLIDIKKRATLNEEQRKTEQAKADEKMRQHWTVKDGILIYDGKGDSLQTVKDYGNFEMFVDWKILPKGDSGLYLRGNPQVQIWDPADHPEGSGGLYNNKKNPSKPLAVADKPIGEWNTFYIKMIGDRVTIKLNDTLVVDNTPLENYWFPGQPLPARGPIELQHHGNTLEFRNIYLRELPENAAAPDTEPKEKVLAAAQTKSADLVTLEVSNVPLSQVIQLLAASGSVEITLEDPDGKLAGQRITFISIRDKPVETAIKLVCNSAGLKFARESGVYFLTARR